MFEGVLLLLPLLLGKSLHVCHAVACYAAAMAGPGPAWFFFCNFAELLLPIFVADHQHHHHQLHGGVAPVIRLSDRFKTPAKRGNNYEMRVAVTVCNCFFDKSQLKLLFHSSVFWPQGVQT